MISSKPVRFIFISNKMRKKHLIIAAALLAGGLNEASAITASPNFYTYAQPDGSTVVLSQRGDENFHFFVDKDGYPVTLSADGYYRYIDADGEVSTARVTAGAKGLKSRKAQIQASPSEVIANYIDKAKPQITYRNDLRVQKSKTEGTPKELVILVEFADRAMTIGDHEHFNNMLNQTDYSFNNATGSCHDYFYENSMQKFDPSFDVYGPVTLSHDFAYYGEDKTGETGADKRAGEMIKEACELLDGEIDFSQYDNDGDGYVDNVYVFFAGKGQHDGGEESAIWPHAHYLQYTDAGTLEADGVTINRYATSNELSGDNNFVGIGVFCHEFTHVLGLPDLYDTYVTSNHTLGSWDLLSTGNYLNEGRTPPNMSAYERYALGWLTPSQFTKPNDITLDHINTNAAYIVPVEGDNDEYFLIENRQKIGWDSFLPWHGMLVWHIDYNSEAWSLNIVNTRPAHQYVDIVEADGIADNETYSGDPFPGTSNKTSFTSETSPAFTSWDGKAQLPITDIAETADGKITFKVLGGKRNLTPTTVEFSDVTPVSFSATWTPCSDCDFQLVSVYTKDGEEKAFVAGLEETRIDTETASISVSGLKPSTTYFVTVTAATDYDTAEIAENGIATLPPTFDMLPVVATDATDVTPTSIVAHWEPLDGATGYELSVKKRTIDNTIYSETNDFTGKTLLDGWSAKAASYFSAKGYYGEAAPAISVATNGDYIESRSYKEVKGLSLWTRTMSYSSLSQLLVKGLNGSTWTTIASVPMAQSSEAGKVYSFSLDDGTLPSGCTAIRLEYASDAEKPGRMLVDDIKIDYNIPDVDETFADYDWLNVGNVTEKAVTELEKNQTYVYTVRGYNEELTSLTSNEIVVDLAAAGVSQVTVAGKVAFADGVLTVQSAPDTSIEVVSTTGQIVDSATTDSLGLYTKRLTDGIYIVKIGTTAYKVAAF